MLVPRTITVLVDSREKKPLLFPESIEWHESRFGPPHRIHVRTVGATLKAGDYAIDGHEPTVLVERKCGLRELGTNFLSDDWARAQRAFERLAASTKTAYLLLDGSPADLWTPRPHLNPTQIFDALIETVVRLRLRLWYGGCARLPRTRRVLGEQVVRVMLAHILRREKGEIENVRIETPVRDP